MQAIWPSVCHAQSSADQIEIVFMIRNTLFHKVYRLASIPLVLLCVSCVSSSKTFLRQRRLRGDLQWQHAELGRLRG